MTPDFIIKADSEDRSAVIKERLLELRLVDMSGHRSDRLELLLDDRDPIARPEHGARLELQLGYKEMGLQRKGVYIHDFTEFSGPPKEILIRAAAVDFRERLKAPRSRSLDNVTLQELVYGIAADHGYDAYVDEWLRDITIPHIDQVAESDLRLLTRMADQYGATFKAAGTSLILIPKAEVRKSDALKAALGTVTLRPSDVSTWRVTRTDVRRFNSVRATWWDNAQARELSYTTEGDTPTYALEFQYGTEQDAKQAAHTKLEQLTRRTVEVAITLPGTPALVADGGLTLEGFRDGVDGSYVLNRVEHIITKAGGYQTKASAELAI